MTFFDPQPMRQRNLSIPSCALCSDKHWSDSCNEQTFISNKLAKQLKLQTTASSQLAINGFARQLPTYLSIQDVDINVTSSTGYNKTLRVKTADFLTTPLNYINLTDQYDICNVSELSIQREQPHILIGIDCYHELVQPSQTRLPTGFYLIDAIFGPIMGGKGTVRRHHSTHHMNSITCPVLNTCDVDEYWSLDSIGIHEITT
ncbi:unnamed protein product [Anisakis simplex]|uniref:DUF1758 domain-containing protein n=1 Tax=Anisakis simplex TaxID=6269 RepID=A0A0M3J533_ANISI|nr:unnamed protein product [Anisakis simplex]